jgi:hypothetical protein
VKTDEKDGFLLAQKAFNDNLPSVFALPQQNLPLSILLLVSHLDF